MATPLNVIGNTAASGCGSCASSGCGTCGTAATAAAPAAEGVLPPRAPTRLSRRQIGRALLAASAGVVLANAGGETRGAAAAPPQGEPVPLDPNLDVVQKGKGPILTVL